MGSSSFFAQVAFRAEGVRPAHVIGGHSVLSQFIFVADILIALNNLEINGKAEGVHIVAD
jgi:hypothetical protein